MGTLGKSHKPYETTEKMKMAKQATTKTSSLTLSGSKISFLGTAILPKNEGNNKNSGALARSARSAAPRVRKCGNLPICGNHVIVCPTVRPHHRHTNVK